VSRNVHTQGPDGPLRNRPKPDDASREATRWRPRRGFALGLRAVVLLAPVAVSVLVAFVVTRVVPAPQPLGARLGWLAAVVVTCGLLAWPARRVLRRLLPLAALLELSILFPGEAPARWKVAREAGSIRHLELLANGVPSSEPVRAATTILALVASLARHDRVTRGHSDRVRVFTDMISEELRLPHGDRDRLRWAALIHDVGKLDVPARLLRKPGKPTSSEWESLRLHPEVGARLVAPLESWLGEHAVVVLQHHEHFDGSGYPNGLSGEQISLGARIVALADAFEVMTAARPYKKASSRAAALREVVRCSGTHFDPDVVRALLALSTPRLRRALGPASWIGQLPVVGTAPVGGLPAVAGTVARGAGTIVLGGMATAVVASSVGAPSSGAPAGSHQQATQSSMPGASSVMSDRTANPADPSASASASATAPLRTQADGADPSGAAPTSAATPSVAAIPQQRTNAAGPPPAPVATEPAGSPTVASDPASTAMAGGAAQGSGNLGGTVDGVVNGVGGTVDGVVNGVGGTVDGVVNGVGGAVGGTPGTTVDGVGDTATGVVDGVGDTTGGLLGGVGGTLSGLLGGH
jgi:hypothetical protein